MSTIHYRLGNTLVLITLFLSAVSVCGLFLIALWQYPEARRADGLPAIRVYCAASVASPIEAALAAYEERIGQAAQLVRQGGSGQLMGQIAAELQTQVATPADLFVSADATLLEGGERQGLIAQSITIAHQQPVIAVRHVFTTPPRTLPELVQGGYRFGIAAESAAIGRIARQLAARHGVLAELLVNAKMETENVMQLAHAVKTGNLEAAVIWDSVVIQLNREEKTDALHAVATLTLPDPVQGRVSVGIVRTSADNLRAREVADFLADPEAGGRFLQAAGFQAAKDRLP